MGTFFVGFVLFVALASIVVKMINDKKNGKSSCNCGECDACGKYCNRENTK